MSWYHIVDRQCLLNEGWISTPAIDTVEATMKTGGLIVPSFIWHLAFPSHQVVALFPGYIYIYIYILFLRAQNTSNVRHQEGQSNQMPGLPAAGFFGCEGTAAWPRDVIHAILMWRYASLCVTLLSGCIHEKLFTEAARDEGWITLSIVFTLFIRVCACAWETVMVYFQLTKTIYDLHRIMICELFFFPEKSWMTDIYDTQAA